MESTVHMTSPVCLGYCATNILWLDLLKPVKFNYYMQHLRENGRVEIPWGIKKIALDKLREQILFA